MPPPSPQPITRRPINSPTEGLGQCHMSAVSRANSLLTCRYLAPPATTERIMTTTALPSFESDIVEVRVGNLFDGDDLPALAQGCNTRGLMGAGIATQFAARWPEMKTTYVRRCKEGLFALGGVFVWRSPEGQVIFNLAVQKEPGRHAELSAISASVNTMLSICRRSEIEKVGLPMIGAGIGGLDWHDVLGTLEDASTEWGVSLVVYEHARP